MSLWDLIITIRIIPLGIRWRSMYAAIQSWILLVPPAKEKPRRLFWVSDHVPMRNWMGMAFSGLLVNCDQIYITDLDSMHTASHHSCLAGQLYSASSTQTAWYPWRGFYSGRLSRTFPILTSTPYSEIPHSRHLYLLQSRDEASSSLS